MKRNNFLKITLMALLGVLLSFTLVGCSGAEGEGKEAEIKNEEVAEVADTYYPITYTTYNYAKEPVEVVIEKAPENVVAVYQNSIETLLALGLEDSIVAAAGLDHKVKPAFEEVFSGVNYLEKWQPTKETVVMLEPDFILSWGSYFSEKRIGDVDYYHNNDIGTYSALNTVVKPRTIKNECEDILTIGKIFNVNDRAKSIVEKINNRVSEIAETAKENEQKTTLIIEFSGDNIWSYGATSLGGDMVTKLGAELLNPEGNDLGMEDIIDLNPDSIFVVYYNGGKRTDEEAQTGAMDNVMKNEALAHIDAVANEKVIAIPLGEMYASGIRTIDGIERIANGIYE